MSDGFRRKGKLLYQRLGKSKIFNTKNSIKIGPWRQKLGSTCYTTGEFINNNTRYNNRGLAVSVPQLGLGLTCGLLGRLRRAPGPKAAASRRTKVLEGRGFRKRWEAGRMKSWTGSTPQSVARWTVFCINRARGRVMREGLVRSLTYRSLL